MNILSQVLSKKSQTRVSIRVVALIMEEMRLQSFLFCLQIERNIAGIFLQKVSSCIQQFQIILNVLAISAVMHKIISNWCEFKHTIMTGDLFVVYVFYLGRKHISKGNKITKITKHQSLTASICSGLLLSHVKYLSEERILIERHFHFLICIYY